MVIRLMVYEKVKMIIIFEILLGMEWRVVFDLKYFIFNFFFEIFEENL